MSTVTMSQEQYAALVSLARAGSSDSERTRKLEAFLTDLDTRNGVTRYVLLVQWQELNSPLPPSTRFPEQWPPQMRVLLERLDRPIAKADVVDAVKKRASSPINILVTRDVGGLVGWTQLDTFFVT